MITKVVLKNFRSFRERTIEFADGLNIVVGDNEAGKSTLLEAINLALTRRCNGKLFDTEFSHHFINSEATAQYLRDLRSGSSALPPEVVIEVFLKQTSQTAHLRGENNSLKEDAPGIQLRAQLDAEAFPEEYAALVGEPSSVFGVPTEFYRIDWNGFDGLPVNPRALKIAPATIDASRIRLQSGADYYLQRILTRKLSPKQRAQLKRAYRLLREQFAEDPSIEEINQFLNGSHDGITAKRLTVEMDTSQPNHWESALSPHLDRLPLHLSGSGEQNKLKILLALVRSVEDVDVILIEEPENHLSFSSLNQLIDKIAEKCDGRQVIVTTHSSFVVNKLGLDQLMLLSRDGVGRLANLSADTQNYFKKLAGFDTLRLVLAKKVILVEGPSDELVVQRAYKDRTGKRPIEDGIDVMAVGGLSAKRFLDLALLLKRRTVVVCDNDGDHQIKVDARYKEYSDIESIRIVRSADDSLKTLEPQLIGANALQVMNEVLGKAFKTADELGTWMEDNKSECALRIHDSTRDITMPAYIVEAIDAVTA